MQCLSRKEDRECKKALSVLSWMEVKNPQIPIGENRFQIDSESSDSFTKQRFSENVLFRFSFSGGIIKTQ